MSWFKINSKDRAYNADIILLIEKGTKNKIISKKFEIIDDGGCGELIYNIKKNYYVLFSNLNKERSHISECWGIKFPEGVSDE